MWEWPLVLSPQGLLSLCEGKIRERSHSVMITESRGGQKSKTAKGRIPTAGSPLFRLHVFPSNPQPLKTSRRPPLIMTRLSNPIAVAQTQGSALNPKVSDCFSRVKWLCPPCRSPGHWHRGLELLRWEPSHRPVDPLTHSHRPHTYNDGRESAFHGVTEGLPRLN